MSELRRLVAAFVSEDAHSLVEALYDALPNDCARAEFTADLEQHRAKIEAIRVALNSLETQPADAHPASPR